MNAYQAPLGEFVSFLSDSLSEAQLESSCGLNLDFPLFDFLPHDYLDFAEAEIEKHTAPSRINCIAHLKRAIECELDTFLFVFNIKGIKSLPSKLHFADKAGLFSSRSIRRLNQIRNRLEHEYAEPDPVDLDAFFDVAAGFVHSVEGCIFILAQHHELRFDRRGEPNAFIRCEMKCEDALISFSWSENQSEKELVVKQSDGIDAFTDAIFIYLLLSKFTCLVSEGYVMGELNKRFLLEP